MIDNPNANNNANVICSKDPSLIGQVTLVGALQLPMLSFFALLILLFGCLAQSLACN